MKNTPENRHKFFAHYWGQDVSIIYVPGLSKGSPYTMELHDLSLTINLVLKNLKDITDEDVRNLKSIDSVGELPLLFHIYKEADKLTHITFVSDYLRSKGYLVPWMGLSCEELIGFMSEMSDEQMEFEASQMEMFFGGINKRSGRIVETRSGLTGRTYNHEDLVNGKVKVYTDNGKLLCSPETLSVKGFID